MVAPKTDTMSASTNQPPSSKNSFGARARVTLAGKEVDVFRLDALSKAGIGDVATLPVSIRILLECLLRREDDKSVFRDHIEAVAKWDPKGTSEIEVQFTPARVLLQDFTGVPAVCDLAAMREAFARLGGNPKRIGPLQPADLVIDHSVQVDAFGTIRSFDENVKLEFERNQERYQFLRWGQGAFDGFRVVPPGTGIVHQVNVEFLANVAFAAKDGDRTLVYPDSLVGTDSHTTMINGLGVLGWGVGGIEAEAAMLGQPCAMLLPQVVGFKLTGKLREGATATDAVLTVTEMLRKKGVVGKFVEFYGPGLDALALTDRATIANMAPEYGATMGFFPVDAETLAYLRFSGRSEDQVKLVEEYFKLQGLFRTSESPELRFSDTVELNLADVVPSIAGPKRPQDRVPLTQAKRSWRRSLVGLLGDRVANVDKAAVDTWMNGTGASTPTLGPIHETATATTDGASYALGHGAVVIAAITSCTNTSNPSVMIAAGLLAKKARAFGLTRRPWVKTSLAPGSQVVTEYYKASGLEQPLNELGFNLVGYGCTTCIGNSGPVPDEVTAAIKEKNLVVSSVLSGNRNFEGRVNPVVQANYLASPPLVVAYALAGTTDIDFETEPLGVGTGGKTVFLRDVWPTQQEIADTIRTSVKTSQFVERYGKVLEGPQAWRSLDVPTGDTFTWDPKSTYIRKPSFFDSMTMDVPPPPSDIRGARVLAMLGDSITTDHISPAGNIAKDSPAAKYLAENGVSPRDYNQYGARRGNHEVMVRGTFANIRLKNEILQKDGVGPEGGLTKHFPTDTVTSIYEGAMKYRETATPLVVVAGKEYGSGSSRDWAAKGTLLLGVRAVIAESYERIHRSNLIGMGVLPLEFEPGATRASLGLKGDETFDIIGISAGLAPKMKLMVEAISAAGTKKFNVTARIDSPQEVEYLLHGGILQYVLRGLAKS